MCRSDFYRCRKTLAPRLNRGIIYICSTNCKNELKTYSAGFRKRPSVFDVAVTKTRIQELKKKAQAPDLWDDPQNAGTLLEELAAKEKGIEDWEALMRALEQQRRQLAALEEMVIEAGNEESPEVQELIEESNNRIEKLAHAFRSLELESFLSGPYDHLGAMLTVLSGAGGRDAEEWAGRLLRMYQRFAEQRGWRTRLLHEHQSEEGGIKSATLEVSGTNAYGWLKGETGTHRLVRISPFDSSKRRHTSFASVEVLPLLRKEEAQNMEISDEDIVFEASKSSGPGGQNVNKRETAVRLTHTPSGITVECQAERTQGANRERAMAMLKAKLIRRREQEREEALAKERGEAVEASWGNQIRSYILHPYKLVKDHRTNVEHHDPEAVLEGDLERFIEAELAEAQKH